MKYPPFVAEMGTEPRRRDLLMGIWSGYVLVGAFGLLTFLAQIEGLIGWDWHFYALVGAKTLTNSLAWICWRTRRFALEMGGINVAMDVIVMTGAIYFTGGQLSPLFAMYVVEIGVLALLTNLGITILAAVGAMLLYGTMAVLTYSHLLPPVPPPVTSLSQIKLIYLITQLAFATFIIATLSFYTSLVLRRLRSHETALEAKARELIDAGREKSQFMTNITHELRTPIHGIMGLTELLESGVYGDVSPKQLDAIGGVNRSAQNLLALIDDLLQLARSDASKLEFHPSKVSIREVVESVVPSVRWMLGTKPIRIEVDLAEGLPDVITDRTKLGHILINLLSNAIKFTNEGGTVSVTARADGADSIMLCVQDTGIGIPERELPHVFDAFRQVDGSASRKYGGVGLGLALVKRLSDLLGTTVSVTSVEARGSTFKLAIPIVPASA